MFKKKESMCVVTTRNLAEVMLKKRVMFVSKEIARERKIQEKKPIKL
jgi:hypothetical protein